MRNYTVGRIWGIPIRISISLVVFLPVLAWLIGSGQQIETYAGLINGLTGITLDVDALQAGNTPWVIGVLAAVGLFVSVALHELGHSWMALRYDIGIESITLWILGGIAALESMPREWNREFWIAIAGPFVSVLLAAVCWGSLLVLPDSVPPALRFVVGWLAVTNLTVTVFNLLPAFPMDGGRIFRALLARSRPYGSATRLAARIGVVFAILFAVVGVMAFSPLLVLLALFIYGAATTESRVVLLDELLEGLTVGDIIARNGGSVDADATVDEFIQRMLREHRDVYPVTDGGEVIGVVTLADLDGGRATDRESPVRSVIREVPRVSAGDDAFDTLAALQGMRTTTALVVDGSDLVGVLSEADYAHVMNVGRGSRSKVAA